MEEIMKNMSIGKLRGLQQISTLRGFLTVVAIDHRESLQRQMGRESPVGYQDMVDFKLDLCRAVALLASAMLLDPEYGAAQAIASNVLPGQSGLLVSLEKSGYVGESNARLTELMPDWGVRKIKMMGASAVKLLIYFRPDIKEVAPKQLELVKRVADECIREDIPLLVESVSYPTADERNRPEEFSRRKPELVLESARLLTVLPIDILKSEFPADISYEKDGDKLEGYCRELSRVSCLPWVLLSAGLGYDEFRQEVEMACKGGASGFMAGRALWQEATRLSSREERQDFFRSRTASRLKELTDLVNRYARPWYQVMESKTGKSPQITEGWYRSYSATV
jgi:tagatose 1,6-diphosphate aldolase